MKTIFAATIAIFAATSAMAGGITEPYIVQPSAEQESPFAFVGNMEYDIENEVFATTLGTQYVRGEFLADFSVMGSNLGGDFDFMGSELTGVYSATDNVNLYGQVSFDDEWDYNTTTIGVAFRF